MNTGHLLPAPQGVNQTIISLLKTCLEKQVFEAVLLSMPSQKGYNYVLLQDPQLLDNTEVFPPIMSVQGGRALFSLTRHGKNQKIAAVMRLCEIRAAIELSKLHQTNLDNITLISMDCPGVMSLSDYMKAPPEPTPPPSQEGNLTAPPLRPICRICDTFSPAETGEVVDLHIGTIGISEGNMLLIPISSKGKDVLNSLEMDSEDGVEHWLEKTTALQEERQQTREQTLSALQEEIRGVEGLSQAFSRCIECHNCGSVCPICYCRLCFAEKGTFLDKADDYVQRADSKGGMKVLSEPLLYHLGRMSHMSLSCVSCGVCEDACPVDIPVGRIFSLVGEATQRIFNYVPGRSREEELPLNRFEQEELTEVEDT